MVKVSEAKAELAVKFPKLVDILISRYADNEFDLKNEDLRLYLNPDQTIPFTCQRCGECCKSTPAPLYPSDIKRLSKAVDNLLSKMKICFIKNDSAPYKQGPFLTLEKNGDYCVFYDKEKGCGVHENKPINCSLLPVKTGSLSIDKDNISLSVSVNLWSNCKGFFKGNDLNINQILKDNLKQIIERTYFYNELESVNKQYESEGKVKLVSELLEMDFETSISIIKKVYNKFLESLEY